MLINIKIIMQSKRRGSALILVTIAAVLLTLVGVGLLQVGLCNRLFAIRSVHKIQACSAADAGLTKALYEMNELLNVQSLPESTQLKAINEMLPYCSDTFSYTVKLSVDGEYVIESTGKSGLAEKTVSATIDLKGLFDNAILTKANLILKSNTSIKGYNSGDPLDTDTDADITTQSTEDSSIVLNSGVVVNGDVRVGLGGDPDTAIKDLGATIAGFKYSITEEDPLPQIDVPADLFNKGTSIFANGETVTIGPDDSGTYTGIELKKSAASDGVLLVDGGDVVLHITGDIELGQSCEIIVKDGSSLTLYADSNIHCREDSGVTVESPTKVAETLKLYTTGQDLQNFDLKAKSEWIGVIYAPNADVDLYAKGEIYGSVVANNFEFKAGGNYNYDKALKNVSTDDLGVRFVIKRWNE